MMSNELKNKGIDDLEHILEALEAQSRFTEIQIKEVKEELEGRKKALPLGVPLKGTLNEMPLEVISRGFIEWFLCKASADKFADYYYNFVEAIQDIAEGKPINIKVLLPLLKKGWVAYCPISRSWFWTNNIPKRTSDTWETALGTVTILTWIGGFNIKPAENWKTSLMECGI